MSKTMRILIWALVAIAIIACIALAVVWLIHRGGDETPADPLAGTKWQVRSYHDAASGGMASPLADTQLTAEFTAGETAGEGVVGGTAGCNNYTASYTVDDDSLLIGEAAATMMFCEGLMDQEAAFLVAIQSASSFELETGRLQILDDQGEVVVDFVPYTPPPEATEPAEDDSWDRIQAAGKMVAGTAADYPPFESYIRPGQLDGFDIALMDEIGRRLGVAIEYHDYAFDGLGPSLMQGQIDVAIAAISRTPEREAVVDFSNVYLVAEDGVLARADSDITIGSADDLVQYKVGVQRNTVYEDWVQTTLIDAGRMSPDNLFAYEKAEDLLRDLGDGRVELAIMDAQAAQAAVEQGGVKLVAKGRGQQSYAIALPKGAAALKTKLDETITGMYNDGTIAGLAQRYLGVAQVLPTPTPAPTSTTAPPPVCVNGLSLVKHLTEEAEMRPGQAFTKGWQIKNTGTCTWDANYQLVFVSGYSMGGRPTAVSRQVNPGETYDLYLDLVAPTRPGDYQSVWQMQDGQGTAFGERLRVAIEVVAAPTATPAPTETPIPGISFSVDRTNIKQGECVTFKWKVENVSAVYFYEEGQRWPDHGVTGEETRVECPAVTTTYYLRAVLPDNSVEVRQITINVEPVADAPQITRFTVDPPGQITLGQCVTIRWRVEGELDRVALAADGGALWDPAPTSGTYQHCPDAAGTVVYALEAIGPGGTSRQQHSTNVVEPATATPVPTTAPEAPVIHSFSVSPNQVEVGECMGVSWRVGGGATYSRILRNGVTLIDDAGYTGQQMDCLDEPGTYTYRLEALNVAGERVSQEQVGIVTETPPQNPLAGTRWLVTVIYDAETEDMEEVLPGTSLAVAFGTDGTVNGWAGCNTFSSTYLVDGDKLTITLPIATSRMCATPAGIMEQEAAFLSVLELADSFVLETNELQILNVSGKPLLDLQTLKR
ncbi:MAG: META domain-containing protein [Promethearchaeota archaeon]